MPSAAGVVGFVVLEIGECRGWVVQFLLHPGNGNYGRDGEGRRIKQ